MSITRTRTLLPLSAIAFAIALIAGCGGPSPEETLDETFTADESITSGVIDLSLDATLEGSTGGSFNFSLNGPFQGGDDPETLPELGLTAAATLEALGQSQSFDGGLVITTDNAFVEYQGQAYEVGADEFAQVQEALQAIVAQGESEGDEPASPSDAIRQSCETTAEQTGGDPSVCDEIDLGAWAGDLTEEEGIEIDGAATTKIHGDLDVNQIIDDFVKIAAASGDLGSLGAAPTEEQVQQVSDAVTEASFDVYSGEEDHLLRGLDFNLGIDPSVVPGASTLGVEAVSIAFSLRFSDINQPQTIEAPTGAKPIDQLFKQLGLDDLGALGLLGGGLPISPGGSQIPSIPEIPGTSTSPTG